MYNVPQSAAAMVAVQRWTGCHAAVLDGFCPYRVFDAGRQLLMASAFDLTAARVGFLTAPIDGRANA